jgi:hypothetical protein
LAWWPSGLTSDTIAEEQAFVKPPNVKKVLADKNSSVGRMLQNARLHRLDGVDGDHLTDADHSLDILSIIL